MLFNHFSIQQLINGIKQCEDNNSIQDYALGLLYENQMRFYKFFRKNFEESAAKLKKIRKEIQTVAQSSIQAMDATGNYDVCINNSQKITSILPYLVEQEQVNNSNAKLCLDNIQDEQEPGFFYTVKLLITLMDHDGGKYKNLAKKMILTILSTDTLGRYINLDEYNILDEKFPFASKLASHDIDLTPFRITASENRQIVMSTEFITNKPIETLTPTASTKTDSSPIFETIFNNSKVIPEVSKKMDNESRKRASSAPIIPQKISSSNNGTIEKSFTDQEVKKHISASEEKHQHEINDFLLEVKKEKQKIEIYENRKKRLNQLNYSLFTEEPNEHNILKFISISVEFFDFLRKLNSGYINLWHEENKFPESFCIPQSGPRLADALGSWLILGLMASENKIIFEKRLAFIIKLCETVLNKEYKEKYLIPNNSELFFGLVVFINVFKSYHLEEYLVSKSLDFNEFVNPNSLALHKILSDKLGADILFKAYALQNIIHIDTVKSIHLDSSSVPVNPEEETNKSIFKIGKLLNQYFRPESYLANAECKIMPLELSPEIISFGEMLILTANLCDEIMQDLDIKIDEKQIKSICYSRADFLPTGLPFFVDKAHLTDYLKKKSHLLNLDFLLGLFANLEHAISLNPPRLFVYNVEGIEILEGDEALLYAYFAVDKLHTHKSCIALYHNNHECRDILVKWEDEIKEKIKILAPDLDYNEKKYNNTHKNHHQSLFANQSLAHDPHGHGLLSEIHHRFRNAGVFFSFSHSTTSDSPVNEESLIHR